MALKVRKTLSRTTKKNKETNLKKCPFTYAANVMKICNYYEKCQQIKSDFNKLTVSALSKHLITKLTKLKNTFISL